MMLHFEVIPVLVFDGGALPMKSDTHKERRERREKNLANGQAALRAGDKRKAEQCFQGAFTVTKEMAREVMKECRKMDVEFLVAPYEADAQLAWMAINGKIDCIITEDSDLVVYGAPKVLYKMGKDGEGDLLQIKNIGSLDVPPMINITPDMFMWMCVCAGCDFFEGVKNMGIKRAHGLVKKQRTLSRLLHSIRADLRYGVTREFMTDFYRACLVFRHQSVLDMDSGKAVHLATFDPARIAMLPSGVIPTGPDGEPDLSFLGTHHSETTMQGIARGEVNPFSLERYAVALDDIRSPADIPSRNNSRNNTPRSLSALRNLSRNQTPVKSPATPKGFQVLAARPKDAGSLHQSANLKTRLSRGPQSFNPRQIASRMSGGTTSRRQRSSVPANGIWNSFKRPRKAHDAPLDRDFGTTLLGLANSKQHVGRKTPRRTDIALPSPKRLKRPSSAIDRTNAISPLAPKNSLDRFTRRVAAAAPPKRRKSTGSTRALDSVPNVDAEAGTEEDGPIYSRFFDKGKRITMPATSGNTRGERQLVRQVAKSVEETEAAANAARKKVVGRAAVNTSMAAEE